MQLSAQAGMLETLPGSTAGSLGGSKGDGSWPALKITFLANKENSQKWVED